MDQIIKNKSNVDITPLRSGKVIVSYKMDSEDVKLTNISVSVSSAIAAYSRMEMSKYLIKYSGDVLCIDTDGIKISRDLDESEIDGKKIGMMKYEYMAEEFITLGPKVYGALIKEGNSSHVNELVKVKGYSSNLPYKELKNGLNREYQIKLLQDK